MDHLFSMCLALFLLLLLPFILLLKKSRKPCSKNSTIQFPVSYPLIGCYHAFLRRDRLNYIAALLRLSPTSSFSFRLPFSRTQIVFTADPDVVQHILAHKFHIYQKGDYMNSILSELLGRGIISTDGPDWKFQRQLAAKIFCNKEFVKLVEKVVDDEISHRLLPVMAQASTEGMVLDLQDLLMRFTFDNICIVAMGHDPKYLSLPLPDKTIATAIDDSLLICSKRLSSCFPLIWKLKRLLNVGPEKRLKEAVYVFRQFIANIIRRRRNNPAQLLDDKQEDFLSKLLEMGQNNETFLIDFLISAILAGRDTSSASLTWFFWLLASNPHVEQRVLEEVRNNENHKEMVYTHACLCEAMRLYPALAANLKEAVEDDVLPDGTRLRRGDKVSFFSYAMGRSERIWGTDWAEFRPERWLERDMKGKWRIVGKDQYTFPVFQAGPRICLGKDIAFIQMKKVVAAIVGNYQIVSMREDQVNPVCLFIFVSKMKNGFPVKFVKREK